MRVIITGGTGLIGSALAKNLVADHHEVIILTRNPKKYVEKISDNITMVAWDAHSPQGWSHLIDETDAIVNLAGESIAGNTLAALIFKRWTKQRLNSILASRLDAGRAIVQAILQSNRKPAVLIQASAVGYYGSRGDEELIEQSSPGQDQIAQICAQWENSTQAVEEVGVRRAIIRTAGVVMSRRGGALPFMMLPFRFFVGGRLGNGKNWFSWIHIEDEVRAIRFLIDHSQAQGPFNLCAPQPITNAEFSRTLGKIMKRPAWFPTPAFALYLLFGEKASILLASQRQIPQRLLELGFEFRFPTMDMALKNILAR